MDYFVLAALWIAWCILHSVMISLTVTAYFRNRLGSTYRYYRLFYNLLSMITFTLLCLYSGIRQGRLLFQWEGGFAILQAVLVMTSVLLVLAGGRNYDILHMIGIRQITNGITENNLSGSGKIGAAGIHGIIRHPWYLGAIIFVWTAFREIYVSTLIINIIVTIYLVTGTILEERKLVIEHGDAYRNYQKKVSMLIPLKWVSSKCSNCVDT